MLAALAWTIQAWRYANPSYAWSEIDGGSYSALTPFQWKAEVIRTSSGTAVIFNRTNPGPALTITDIGATTGTLVEEVKQLRKREIEPSSVKRVRLANGIEAATWSASRPLTVEFGESYRKYVFLGTNGRLYSSTYFLSSFKKDWLSDNLTRRILGSMKFKDVPAPKK